MQQIIVYRNPLEAAFWNSAASGQLFPFLVWGILTIAAIAAIHYTTTGVLQLYNNFHRHASLFSYIELLVGGGVAFLIVHFFL